MWLGIQVLPVPRPGGKPVIHLSHFHSSIIAKEKYVIVVVVSVLYFWFPVSVRPVIIFLFFPTPYPILYSVWSKSGPHFSGSWPLSQGWLCLLAFLKLLNVNSLNISSVLSLYFCNFTFLLQLLSGLKALPSFLCLTSPLVFLVIFPSHILLALTQLVISILTPPPLWCLHRLLFFLALW